MSQIEVWGELHSTMSHLLGLEVFLRDRMGVCFGVSCGLTFRYVNVAEGAIQEDLLLSLHGQAVTTPINCLQVQKALAWGTEFAYAQTERPIMWAVGQSNAQ